MCDRWKNFENFLSDMGSRPEGMSLDRIDNDGDYEPSNCRWATNQEQFWNKRNTVKITANGRTQKLYEWARELNIDSRTIYCRLYRGWTQDRAINTPIQKRSAFRKREKAQ